MDALMDHAAVVAMTVMMAWPLLMIAVLLPLTLAVLQRRRADWWSSRRSRAAVSGFVLGVLAGGPAAFALFGGGVGDLRYWLDWAVVAAFAIVAGAYLALIAYLAAGIGRRSAS